MKHLYRKPLLPVLLMLILVIGSCFVTLFQKSMAEDRQRIEDIYNNTHIYVDALPADDSSSTLRLVVHRGDGAASLEEITDSMLMLQCYYALETPQEEIFSTIYGTNNPDELAKQLNFQISWGDSWNRDTFLDTDIHTGCLMDASLADALSLSVGDTFCIFPTLRLGEPIEDAPLHTLTLAGTFSGKQSSLDVNGLIVPNTIFVRESGLLFNANMMVHSYYRIYRLELNPAYNRDIETVLEKIEEKLIGKFKLVTNARTMKQAIRPIEQKLLLEEMLELPLIIIFSVATVVISLLLSLSLKTELFLRFLVGEGRIKVFFKIMGSLLLTLVLCTVFSLGAVCLVAGNVWLESALNYLKFTLLFATLAMAIPLMITCNKNLVKLYQQREG